MARYRSQKWARGALVLSSRVLNVQEMSAIIGMTPTEAYERELNNSATYDDRSTAVWILRSNLSDEATLEEHIETLLKDMEAHADALIGLASDCSIELHLMFSSDNGQGSLTLDPPMLARFANLPILFSLDLCYPEDFPPQAFTNN